MSKVEQCVDILMAEGRHGSPEKQKVVRRTLASVLMQEKDLSAEMAAVVSNILMYKINCVYCCFSILFTYVHIIFHFMEGL